MCLGPRGGMELLPRVGFGRASFLFKARRTPNPGWRTSWQRWQLDFPLVPASWSVTFGTFVWTLNLPVTLGDARKFCKSSQKTCWLRAWMMGLKLEFPERWRWTKSVSQRSQESNIFEQRQHYIIFKTQAPFQETGPYILILRSLKNRESMNRHALFTEDT